MRHSHEVCDLLRIIWIFDNDTISRTQTLSFLDTTSYSHTLEPTFCDSPEYPSGNWRKSLELDHDKSKQKYKISSGAQ